MDADQLQDPPMGLRDAPKPLNCNRVGDGQADAMQRKVPSIRFQDMVHRLVTVDHAVRQQVDGVWIESFDEFERLKQLAAGAHLDGGQPPGEAGLVSACGREQVRFRLGME